MNTVPSRTARAFASCTRSGAPGSRRVRSAGALSSASEMDADVKCGWWCGVLVCGHGGGYWDRAAGATAATTVTLRCAGRNRMQVSGRELARTRVASRDRIEDVEGAPGCTGRPIPAVGVAG